MLAGLFPGDLDIAVVGNYISEMKRVYAAVEGRIIFINSKSGPVSATNVTRPSSASASHVTRLLPLLGLVWTLLNI